MGGGEWVCGVCVCGGGGVGVGGGGGGQCEDDCVEHCSVASHIVDQRLNCP